MGKTNIAVDFKVNKISYILFDVRESSGAMHHEYQNAAKNNNYLSKTAKIF